MMKKIIIILVFLNWSFLLAHDDFEKEIAFFQIQNYAILIKKGDSIIYQKHENKRFPIASLTKIFSGVLMMQLVENHHLNLNDAVIKYVPESHLPFSIKLKHLLSHTSQGEVGKAFYYSNGRYALLTKILENVSKKSFETLLEEQILKPATMQHTFLLKDSAQITQYNIEKGHVLRRTLQKGLYEYGFSASGGLVSSVADLAQFDRAWDTDILITEKSKTLMSMPFYVTSPYGLGIFAQKVCGTKVVWGYGQTSSFSSLYIKIPEKQLTFIIIADNNLICNAAKLIYGDIRTSIFALKFLTKFVFQSQKKFLETERIFATALNESNLGNYQKAKELWTSIRTTKSLSKINKIHLLFTLKSNLRTTTFDKLIEQLGKTLVKKEPHNPYLHFYLGNFYDLNGNSQKANLHFTILKTLPNFDKNWYTKEAEDYLKNYYQAK